MPRPKGLAKTGGRKKDTPNKATKETRELFVQLVEERHDDIGVWLDKVAAKDPGKAVDLILRIAEYFIPKLARSEVDLSNSDGSLQPTTIIVNSKEDAEEIKKLRDRIDGGD